VENALNDFLCRFRVEGEYSNYCGLYGYTSFNAVRYFENIPVKDSREATNDAPDMLYILYKYLIVFNDFKNEMLLLEMLAPGETSGLDQVQKAIHNRNYTAYDFRAIGPTTSPLTDEEHKANIRRGIAHCLRGDVFQIVLSRRFEQRFTGDDFKLYRALRSINPSPYLFYFDFGGFRIFGSSPETHCRIEGRHAYIDPIAGTTKRTGDAEQDALNARYLHDDPKENAEHVMLLDLSKIQRATQWACAGLNVSQSDLETSARLPLYDGIKTKDIQIAFILAASDKISPTAPDWTYVAARLLLQTLYKQANDGSIEYPSWSDYAKNAIDKGLMTGWLNDDSNFDLAAIDAAIDRERDFNFDYLGLQTLADRYLLKDENDVVIELPQHMLMRVAMGVALNEQTREARTAFVTLRSSLITPKQQTKPGVR
jgi:hypothetical protein